MTDSYARLEIIAAELLDADMHALQTRKSLYELVQRMYDEGEQPSRIAQAAGMTRQRVNQIVNKGKEAS